MKPRLGSVRQQPDFVNLWAAHTVSAFGSAVTGVALPLTAVLALGASPAQMCLLRVAGGVPALLFSLFAGVWVDRLRRRPVLIGADLGRALLLRSVPVAALLGLLRMEHLYVVAFLTGALSLFFDIAVTSYLPVLIRRKDLVGGNTRLQVSDSVASVAGPGLGGVLTQLLTAPVAIAFDALSFALSALLLRRIHAEEAPLAPLPERRDVWREIGEGLRFLLANPLLRAMTVSSALGSLALSMQVAVLVLFATRSLGLSPALLGLIFASRGIASLVGAVLAGRAGRAMGAGPAVVWGTLLSVLGSLVIPLAGGSLVVAVPTLVAAQVLLGIGSPIYSVNQITLRQSITPDRVLGRVNASRRFLVFGAAPVSALFGGTLGSLLGLRPTLLAGALILMLAFLTVLLSPLRRGMSEVAFLPRP